MGIDEPAQLAQLNVARFRHPVDDPRLAEFFEALDRVNALADRSPGFVWRHRGAHGHLDGAELLGDERIVLNLSVWTGYRPLHQYVYRSGHGAFVRRRTTWFEPLGAPSTVLWWVPAGHRPTPTEAVTRWRYLRRYGPEPRAFTVRRRFDQHGAAERAR